tara:strand:+ start:162 stop:1328 length:1167 start_codon:yes stop_codon:yes gene_type:complete
MTIQQKMVPVSTEMSWAKIAKTCTNPFGLTDKTVQDSLKVCPPVEYEGGTFLGRYIIPDAFVRYNPEEQPRDKSNDADHVNDLVNNYEVHGYMITANPPIASFDEQSIDQNQLRGQSGFNRKESREKFGQEMAIYDVYEWETRYHEVVARNKANHHQNPQLSQTKHDYLKEVCNAVAANVIPADADAINDFVDVIASDKTSKIRNWIKKTALNNCQVYPNFRTYNSTGTGKDTLKGFLVSQKYPRQGVEGRDDTELKEQGCITYCAGNGDNMQAWARGIQHGTNKDLIVWIFGYAPNRVPDLEEFRKDWIEDFNNMKQTYITFASNIAEDGESIVVDEDIFPVKFAGFLPQYVKPDPKAHGKPTENTLIDQYGQSIKFDPDGDCLTIK